ncbi:DUF4192 domain-containing protein [Nonomuraea sp. NPDC059194]|uniref:DUF4192 domain-containing protein n=1 Tax=Nonomuraea sp. NPDC059194 TaxID=3346764 RepID=UPI0036B432C7
MSTDLTESALTLTTPADILAAVPYIVGFHPSDSLVVIGLAGRVGQGEMRVCARWNLPLPPGSLRPLAALFARESITHLVAVGYGIRSHVTPAVDELNSIATWCGVVPCEILRAHEGRYWSYVCELPGCCSVDGTPYDTSTSRIAAAATVQGLVALPNRATLEATIAPHTGPVRLSMRQATAGAVTALRTAMASAPDADRFARRFVADGLARVRAAIEIATSGGRIDDKTVARLGLDLSVIRIRDEAWTLLDDTTQPAHLALWKDLTRRLEPRFVPPAASLLAMSAWRGGECVLATIALERALAIDPTYSMANLLMHALQHLLSPNTLRDRMPNPAELDAAMGTPHASWLLPLTAVLDEKEEALS